MRYTVIIEETKAWEVMVEAEDAEEAQYQVESKGKNPADEPNYTHWECRVIGEDGEGI